MDKKIVKEPVKGVNKIINMIPGTLIYKGFKKENFSIEKTDYNLNSYVNEIYSTCNEKFIDDVNKTTKDMVQWINVIGINNIKEIDTLGNFLNINPMILEQVLDISKHSEYKITENYLFNNLQMIYLKDDIIINETLSIYLCENTLITFQERQGDVFDSIRDRVKKNEGYIRCESSIYSYFCILDLLVDHYINVLEKMKNDIEKMELKLMENQTLDNKELHLLRKEILIIRLSATPIEKLVQDLLLIEYKQFKKQKKYFESLLQHLKYTLNELVILKESVDNLYENYMMTNANDMNHVMTILTIFSAIFIPLSFAAGVFGMNFEKIPGLKNPLAFLYFLIGCGITSFIMLFIFKRNKWF